MGIPPAHSLDPSLEMTPLRTLSVDPPVICVMRMVICAMGMTICATEMVICDIEIVICAIEIVIFAMGMVIFAINMAICAIEMVICASVTDRHTDRQTQANYGFQTLSFQSRE